MLSGPNPVTNIGKSIFGIAGYYTDNDENLQHVIVAATDVVLPKFL